MRRKVGIWLAVVIGVLAFSAVAFADIVGTSGDDHLVGGSGPNTIYGLAGGDAIYGNGGADWISGGDDSDGIQGGTGDDELHGDNGPDVMWGGCSSGCDSGEDLYYANGGDDFILADDNYPDVVHCGSGEDTVDRDNDGIDTIDPDCEHWE